MSVDMLKFEHGIQLRKITSAQTAIQRLESDIEGLYKELDDAVDAGMEAGNPYSDWSSRERTKKRREIDTIQGELSDTEAALHRIEDILRSKL